ncbi:MAG TPA: metalloregulator ArsR/SmtB family transcription factor [Iamia sp.]|nr:metalloregulator ArsR/SmtB family transcription factor [Iamia sp.]
MDEVFKALADPVRRELLDRLRARNGQSLGELGEGLGIARQSVTKHLAVLEAAGLVVSEKHGRQRIHLLNAAPIDDIADRWIGRFHRPRARALGDLKHALEAPPMTAVDTTTTTDFVYVTYIRTTAEELFRAITEPEFTRRYWGAELHSDWQVGSPLRWEEGGSTIEGQEVLAVDPPRLLSYSWHLPEVLHQEHTGWTDEQLAAGQQEPRSKVTFTIDDEADGGTVKLTVVHDGFAPGSIMLDAISGGWPSILASLKSLLETGSPLGA